MNDQQEEEHQTPLNNRQKGMVRMRSIMDWGMGILWMSMGVFLVFIEKFDLHLARLYGDTPTRIFGGVCILYGAFRIYRGYKKKYFNP